MKIRIGAISGVISSRTPDAFGASDTSAPSSETPLLSADETIVLDVLITAAAVAALASPATTTGQQRVQTKVAAMPAWDLLSDVTSVGGIPKMTTHNAITVQAEQGVRTPGIDGTVAAENKIADIRHAATDKIFNAASIGVTVTVAAPVQPEIATPRPTASSLPPRMDVAGGGHAGHGNSQPDEEQSTPSAQFAWANAAAAGPDKVLLGLYQPPLFNRRLETNGVDDALLLALDAARREAMTVGHVVVPPVRAVMEITTMAPVVLESRQAPEPPQARPDTDARVPSGIWPRVPRWRNAITTRANLALAATVPKRAPASPGRMRCAQSQFPYPLMSDSRGSDAAERVACWVIAGGLIGVAQVSRRSARPHASSCALRPVGSQRISCFIRFSIQREVPYR